ncbi:MAG: MarR family winged helix-turn-helix transcriptional regulator [Propionibacteriaceae bacterium]|jgi:MarR family transcriptional regulator for hemolysin|nr:MarR family winged helix-turn-helix transcriptional regulator [Propionibacteriaceae bacterium]
MREYQFRGNFLYYVRLAKRLNEATLAAAARQTGLSLPEADVLSFLRENPEFDTAKDVALYREVSRAYVSKAVDALVQRGYLDVTPDPADRRLQHLRITEAARDAAEVLHAAQFAFYDRVTAGLSNAEVTALLATIEKCAANLVG